MRSGWGGILSDWITHLGTEGYVETSKEENLAREGAFFCPLDESTVTNPTSPVPAFSSYKALVKIGWEAFWEEPGGKTAGYKLNRMIAPEIRHGFRDSNGKVIQEPFPFIVESVFNDTSTSSSQTRLGSAYIWGDYFNRGNPWYYQQPHLNARRSKLYSDGHVENGTFYYDGSNNKCTF